MVFYPTAGLEPRQSVWQRMEREREEGRDGRKEGNGKLGGWIARQGGREARLALGKWVIRRAS